MGKHLDVFTFKFLLLFQQNDNSQQINSRMPLDYYLKNIVNLSTKRMYVWDIQHRKGISVFLMTIVEEMCPFFVKFQHKNQLYQSVCRVLNARI